MARPAGSSGIPQRPTAAAHAQRTDAGRQSRPGRRPLSPREERDRERAVRIGRALNLPLLELVQKRVRQTTLIEKRVDRELAEARPDFELIAGLRGVALTGLEQAAMLGQVADRFGQPRRTINDLRASGEGTSPPVVIAVGHLVKQWDEDDTGGAHDPAAAAGPHGDSGPH